MTESAPSSSTPSGTAGGANSGSASGFSAAAAPGTSSGSLHQGVPGSIVSDDTGMSSRGALEGPSSEAEYTILNAARPAAMQAATTESVPAHSRYCLSPTITKRSTASSFRNTSIL